MDSTVDYGIPLVKPKKGFLQKLRIFKKKLTQKIFSNAKKVIKSKRAKSLARLEIPAQIISVIVLGTLLGAAYAVTMQNDDRYIANMSEALQPEVGIPQIIPHQKAKFPDPINSVFLEDRFSKSKPDVVEPRLSKSEQEKFNKLEEQLLLLKLKSAKLDLSDLQLKKKLNSLVIKNRLLSDKLRRIDQVSNAIKNRYGE